MRLLHTTTSIVTLVVLLLAVFISSTSAGSDETIERTHPKDSSLIFEVQAPKSDENGLNEDAFMAQLLGFAGLPTSTPWFIRSRYSLGGRYFRFVVLFLNNATAETVLALRGNITVVTELGVAEMLAAPAIAPVDSEWHSVPLAIAATVTVCVIVGFLIVFAVCMVKNTRDDGGTKTAEEILRGVQTSRFESAVPEDIGDLGAINSDYAAAAATAGRDAQEVTSKSALSPADHDDL